MNDFDFDDDTLAKEAFENLINFRTKAIKKEAFDINNFGSEGTASGQFL